MKIPAFRDDFGIAGVPRGRRPPASSGIALAEGRWQRFVTEMPQHMTVILQAASDDVDDVAVGVALDDAVDGHQPRAHDDLALLLEYVGPDDQVRDAALVLERDEDDALGAARSLADQDQAGDRQPFAVADVPELVRSDEF